MQIINNFGTVNGRNRGNMNKKTLYEAILLRKLTELRGNPYDKDIMKQVIYYGVKYIWFCQCKS